jgi:hypothetical protein
MRTVGLFLSRHVCTCPCAHHRQHVHNNTNNTNPGTAAARSLGGVVKDLWLFQLACNRCHNKSLLSRLGGALWPPLRLRCGLIHFTCHTELHHRSALHASPHPPRGRTNSNPRAQANNNLSLPLLSGTDYGKENKHGFPSHDKEIRHNKQQQAIDNAAWVNSFFFLSLWR